MNIKNGQTTSISKQCMTGKKAVLNLQNNCRRHARSLSCVGQQCTVWRFISYVLAQDLDWTGPRHECKNTAGECAQTNCCLCNPLICAEYYESFAAFCRTKHGLERRKSCDSRAPRPAAVAAYPLINHAQRYIYPIPPDDFIRQVQRIFVCGCSSHLDMMGSFKEPAIETMERTRSPRAAESEMAKDLRNFVPGTPEEKRLVRKIDLYLMPILWIKYVFNYIDRTNIVSMQLLRA